jgi:hypothetical protein
MTKYQVTSDGLNLRSTPEIAPHNIRLVLAQGQVVTGMKTNIANDQFWEVRTAEGIQGFASKSFLSAIPAGPIKTTKVLWVVNYPDGSLDSFIEMASFIGATAVAIRTDNDLDAAIPRFHSTGIKVYGWRWPSADRVQALAEAQRVVDWYGRGLDGYYVDPEGAPGHHYDWNLDGLAPIAKEFCETITQADPHKSFGTTSHFRAEKIYSKLPWTTFFQYSNILLPQAYWKVAGGLVNGGDPQQNYDTSLAEWSAAGGSLSAIIPMAGELEFSTAENINSYAQEAAQQGKTELHFYAATKNVPSAVWEAIKQIR